ncbi:GNAT family N-acetyltransferase [Pseudomonas fluorescens]|uniref:GNAT family N-acetyltransferase n=1 Tax=Pseudomonas fluorescens TaxID=294 RepID=UPI0007D05AAD|nr:GNAT family N-acetyltransferase [Pseudomonas fluorescens]
MNYLIRKATHTDAPAISQTIIHTLRESNAQDYSPEIINQVTQHFTPEAILQWLTERQVLVATIDSRVVATASMDKNVVRSVFVDPRYQGKGIGRHLMAQIESSALDAGMEVLRVPSSITAEGFYASLGFQKIRDEFHGSERTIIMAKALDL